VVVPVRPVPSLGAHRPLDRLLWRDRTRGVLPLGLQRRDDRVGLSGQQRLQRGTDPRQALRMGLPQQGIGRVPKRLGGRDDGQDQGGLGKGGHQLRLPRLCASRERHARLDVGALVLSHPLRQPAHGVRLPRPGGPPVFAHGYRAGRRPRMCVIQPSGHHLLGGAWGRAHGVETGDHGCRLLGPLLPLAQAHGRCLGGRRHPRHPCALGWHHQDRGGRRWGGWLGGLLLEGRHLSGRLHDRGCEGLGPERPPQKHADLREPINSAAIMKAT
jgi:hypothetical protein